MALLTEKLRSALSVVLITGGTGLKKLKGVCCWLSDNETKSSFFVNGHEEMTGNVLAKKKRNNTKYFISMSF